MFLSDYLNIRIDGEQTLHESVTVDRRNLQRETAVKNPVIVVESYRETVSRQADTIGIAPAVSHFPYFHDRQTATLEILPDKKLIALYGVFHAENNDNRKTKHSDRLNQRQIPWCEYRIDRQEDKYKGSRHPYPAVHTGTIYRP